MMRMKIILERLLVESSKLQDHRQQSCVIRNVTVESVGSSGHRVKTNVDRNDRVRYMIKHSLMYAQKLGCRYKRKIKKKLQIKR